MRGACESVGGNACAVFARAGNMRGGVIRRAGKRAGGCRWMSSSDAPVRIFFFGIVFLCFCFFCLSCSLVLRFCVCLVVVVLSLFFFFFFFLLVDAYRFIVRVHIVINPRFL